jgi:hypothetical protein
MFRNSGKRGGVIWVRGTGDREQTWSLQAFYVFSFCLFWIWIFYVLDSALLLLKVGKTQIDLLVSLSPVGDFYDDATLITRFLF